MAALKEVCNKTLCRPHTLCNFFVYGTLRDDNDTGASYTHVFVKGAERCRSAFLENAELYSLGPYPYVLLRDDKHHGVEDNDGHAQRRYEVCGINNITEHGDSVRPLKNDDKGDGGHGGNHDGGPRNCVVVWGRLITFPLELMEEKLRLADEIEGYDPSVGREDIEEEAGGYLRKEVSVRVWEKKAGSKSSRDGEEEDGEEEERPHHHHHEEERAYLYFKRKHPVGWPNTHLRSGDWMKRRGALLPKEEGVSCAQ